MAQEVVIVWRGRVLVAEDFEVNPEVEVGEQLVVGADAPEAVIGEAGAEKTRLAEAPSKSALTYSFRAMRMLNPASPM